MGLWVMEESVGHMIRASITQILLTLSACGDRLIKNNVATLWFLINILKTGQIIEFMESVSLRVGPQMNFCTCCSSIGDTVWLGELSE